VSWCPRKVVLGATELDEKSLFTLSTKEGKPRDFRLGGGKSLGDCRTTTHVKHPKVEKITFRTPLEAWPITRLLNIRAPPQKGEIIRGSQNRLKKKGRGKKK